MMVSLRFRWLVAGTLILGLYLIAAIIWRARYVTETYVAPHPQEKPFPAAWEKQLIPRQESPLQTPHTK